MGYSSAAVARMASSDASPVAETQQQLTSINEVESMIDLSALLIEKGGRLSPGPPFAEESDVSSVSTRSSVASYTARDSLLDDTTERTTSTSTTSSSVASPTKTIPPTPTAAPRRPPLQWEFAGLTLWIELEEFNHDLTNCIHYMSTKHGTERIPQSHMTAIYGMTHLSSEEACRRLRCVPAALADASEGGGGGRWPKFRRPIGIVQDVAVAGNPGQVCSIAWAQLTLASSPDHEVALDVLYDIFYGKGSTEKAERHRPWTPHNSFAYDNPEGSVLTTEGAFEAVAQYPTLLSREREVAAISLWDTNGRMQDWRCLERVKF